MLAVSMIRLPISNGKVRFEAVNQKLLIKACIHRVRFSPTFPVPPSPTSTSLKVGTSVAIVADVISCRKRCKQQFRED